jgi:hypothetical protein
VLDDLGLHDSPIVISDDNNRANGEVGAWNSTSRVSPDQGTVDDSVEIDCQLTNHRGPPHRCLAGLSRASKQALNASTISLSSEGSTTSKWGAASVAANSKPGGAQPAAASDPDRSRATEAIQAPAQCLDITIECGKHR